MHETPFRPNHWIAIDKEHLDRYQRMFEWNPASKTLYEPADIRAGHIVAEFGCGPGHTAVEIANWVGCRGHVHALDINAAFVEMTEKNARLKSVADRVTAHRSDGRDLPFPDASLDRVTTRNTLIYVEDPIATLGGFRRALRPGGKMHAIEGDWPMMVVEPIPKAEWDEIVSAASHACRTPEIGRKLTGLFAASGFRDIEVDVVTRPDMDGRLLPMIETIFDYARENNEFASTRLNSVLSLLQQGITEGKYLAVAPQFVVTGLR